ncbi:hypothetical protein F4859DRAFT_15613 [Xylaria cf. heliscus]|nr:hypothetical protein F4859DRAFT_15613 [Xylaria cf. heliscus]
MAPALRLTALSYLVAHANARWFQTGSNAGDWAPVTPTSQPAASSPDEWIPKTTSAPERRPFDWELRRRDDSSPTVCGYSVGDLDGPAVTCDSGEFCRLDKVLGIVGCCTATNPRGCIVPTTCLESSKSAQWSGDPLTTYCSDSSRPHCVTHSYDANFYDPLYGAYFIGCAARAASGDIVVSSVPGSGADSTNPLSTFTTTDGVRTTTVTVSVPGGGGGSSSTGSPSSSGSSSSRNVGAIAGGVVGGVAGLALIVTAIFLFLYRRRRRLQASDPLALGRKMPPSDHDIYPNEPIPGSQYPSTFYGEAPPGMAQTLDQPIIGYPPNPYGMQNTIYTAGNNASAEVPAYHPPRAVPSKPQDDTVSPIEESPVSPVSPAENYNTMVSALSNQSPPLQPLQPAVHRQHTSEYAQYSPPPPEQYQSYHPYPGT